MQSNEYARMYQMFEDQSDQASSAMFKLRSVYCLPI
jgi:hypothetical protein